MTEVVLDASVVLKWFRARGEANVSAARALRVDYEAGTLTVLAPSLLRLELINVAARRWQLAERRLLELAQAVGDLGFQLVEPPLESVARWSARGLTAYDAAYVAVAEATGAPLVTDDELILSVASGLARPLA